MTKGSAVVLLGGIATQAVAVLCWYGAWQLTGADTLKLWFNLILPFGALMLGFLGGCGFWLAGRAVKHPSTRGLAVAATAIAIVAFVAIRYLGYWMLEYQGVPVHTMIGFGAYLTETLGHARMDFAHGSQALGSVDLGAFGYMMEALQAAAYAASSYGFAAKLPPAVRCDRCNRSMADREEGTIHTHDQSQFRAMHEALPAAGADRLAALRGARPDGEAPGPGTIRLFWRLAECPDCSNAALVESGALHNGQYFAPLAVLARSTRFDRRRASPPAPAPAMPVAPRGFGRRAAP